MKIFVCASLALAFPVTVWAAPATPLIAPSNVEARGLAALDRAVEFYHPQKSFALSGHDTLRLGDEVVRSLDFELSLQAPERALLKITRPGDAATMLSVRLLDAESYRVIASDQAETVKPIPSAADREAAILDLTNALPALGLSVGAFALGTNPARTEFSTVVGFESAPDDPDSEIVTTRNQTASDPNAVVIAQYTLDARTGAVRKLLVSLPSAGGEVTIATEFEPSVSNWQGSQAATDAAIYNLDALTLPTPAVALADLNVNVEPRARAVFERTVALYGDLDALHLVWTQVAGGEFADETENASLDFDRAGRLRLQYPGLLSSLVVVNVPDQWTLQSQLLSGDGPLLYEHTADADKGAATTALMLAGGLTRNLYDLLTGIFNPLDPFVLRSRAGIPGFVRFEARLLEPQNFGGQTCDLVQTTDVSKSQEDDREVTRTQQLTYWLAREDGRLMRVQERNIKDSETAFTLDSQITEQTFHPTFAPDTFKFVPPAGAQLKAN